VESNHNYLTNFDRNLTALKKISDSVHGISIQKTTYGFMKMNSCL